MTTARAQADSIALFSSGIEHQPMIYIHKSTVYSVLFSQ